jgi:hypothetical protein
MRESIDPMATPGAGAASRWSAPAAGEPRAGRSARTHRADEFPAGYSSAGCSPAEPTSASPAASIMDQDPSAGDDSPANGNLSPFSLSHHRGSVHLGLYAKGTEPTVHLAILARAARHQRTKKLARRVRHAEPGRLLSRSRAPGTERARSRDGRPEPGSTAAARGIRSVWPSEINAIGTIGALGQWSVPRAGFRQGDGAL